MVYKSSTNTGGSGGASIGAPVVGGTANEILYVDASGNLAQSPGLTFDGSSTFQVSPSGDGSLNITNGYTYIDGSGGLQVNSYLLATDQALQVYDSAGDAVFNVNAIDGSVTTLNNILDDGSGNIIASGLVSGVWRPSSDGTAALRITNAAITASLMTFNTLNDTIITYPQTITSLISSTPTISSGATLTTANLQWTPNGAERVAIFTGVNGSNGYGSSVLMSNNTAGPGQTLGILYFGQLVSGLTGTNPGLKASIAAVSSSSTGAAGGYGADLVFATRAAASSGDRVERMRITSTGVVNVGIPAAINFGQINVQSANQNVLMLNYSGAYGATGGTTFGLYADTQTAHASGDRLGGMVMGGSFDTSTTVTNAVSFSGWTNQAWSSGNTGSQARIEVTPSGSGTRTTLAVFDFASSSILSRLQVTDSAGTPFIAGIDSNNYIQISVGSTGASSFQTIGTNPNIVMVPGGTGHFIATSLKNALGDQTTLDGTWTSGTVIGDSGGDKFLIGRPVSVMGGGAVLAGANSTLTLFSSVKFGGTFLAFGTGSTPAEVARFSTTGNLLLRTTADSGLGFLQFAASTNASQGIDFGGDVQAYRRAAGTLEIASSYTGTGTSNFNGSLYVGTTINPSADTGFSFVGQYWNTNKSGTANCTYKYGVVSAYTNAISSGSGNVTGLVGVNSILTNSGTGLVTNGYNFLVQATQSSASSQFTNVYGLYIENQAVTGVTNAFGVRQIGATTQNIFDGKVKSGVATLTGFVATVNLTAQTAALSATTIYAIPAGGSGMYSIAWCASITTAGSASSTLGGTTGFQIIYTDVNDSVVKTSNPAAVTNMTSTANTTGTTVGGSMTVYALQGTNIQAAFGYLAATANSMAYDLNISVTALF